MKKLFRSAAVLALAAALLVSLTACGKEQETQPETEEPVQEAPATLRVGALKGPTAMGLVELMKASDLVSAGEEVPQAYDNLPDAVDSYTFTLAAAATELAPQLVKGDLDIACVPANLAATLYQQTEGEVVTLGINTLGVLYIVENGNAVQSLADLEGKTMVASGKDSTPEYALRYLLEENGVDPDTGVVIDWKNEHSECVSALASGAATIALLPQPFVTVAESKMPELRTALDLTEQWDALDNGSALITGVVVARRDVVEAHPQAVERFLEQYAASVDWVNANTADAAALIGEYGIVDAAVAEKALPACNIVCITGSEMKEKLSGYLQVLCDASADSVGGAMPGDDFYYGAE
ncbi:MqnA/MqnD/SBP family protein [uncultured Oscillibacter sp.]|uniref:ABC transporter substrate-binding protein n=1 Tax=uncultured Oscillibacter sp. TaxID=876091 RepID=UPI002804881C|nr:MqnA/MqnD/SBP family protein [uncultured Oscillibacter sp.]